MHTNFATQRNIAFYNISRRIKDRPATLTVKKSN
ncbi:hypothetical protein KPSA3_04286 [Pseudomonas syringae pv. actinidiae]|uniref:Uncharacterized protein n=1 Tax=Pseudomonas syringae pv. actinidiae TaxID=103796 RepID=A0AAN4Q9W1_PSESF|nr:hypothetical protein KPSA3_04286 [Pseudomonas syringae pv. actinidiae]